MYIVTRLTNLFSFLKFKILLKYIIKRAASGHILKHVGNIALLIERSLLFAELLQNNLKEFLKRIVNRRRVSVADALSEDSHHQILLEFCLAMSAISRIEKLK